MTRKKIKTLSVARFPSHSAKKQKKASSDDKEKKERPRPVFFFVSAPHPRFLLPFLCFHSVGTSLDCHEILHEQLIHCPKEQSKNRAMECFEFSFATSKTN